MVDAGADERSALADELRLAMTPGIGPRLRIALLERFGDPAAVFAATPSDLRDVPGVGPKLASAIARAREEIDVDAQINLCRERGVEILTQACPVYPRSLREIYDPPTALFLHGQLLPQDALAIAIVGSRHATHYGTTQAERLAGSLARAGLTIVSGLARGIDAAAHRGALSASGRTVAVLGSGVLNIYPAEHAELAWEIRQHGALMSESPPLSPPLSGTFPQRNRIISGLSLGVVVIEATTTSGALISARHALEQGREVFAMPGRVDSRQSHGCHRLIRDGAKLVETADDILEELGPLAAPELAGDGRELRHPAELQLNDVERRVLDAVRPSATSVDEVVNQSGLPTPQVLATISILEMKRLVRRVSGASVMRL